MVPYWRVYWNTGPGAFVADETREIELRPGRVIAIPPRTVYSTRTERGVSHFYVHFMPDFPYSAVTPGLRLFADRRLCGLAASLAADVVDGRASSARTRLQTEVYIAETLLSLPDKDVPRERTPDPRIAAALTLMERHSRLSVPELAKQVHMSRTTFIELFQREMGEAPQRFFRRKRLEKACVLLHFSDQSIPRIAEETGFFDRYHFSRLFKRVYGYGPAAFRKQIVRDR